jgi:hypothetical protein
MKEIQCRGGSFIVDDEDFDKVDSYTWRVDSHGYITANTKKSVVGYKRKIYLHRLILGFPKGKKVDHINGILSDNRKENLRTCTNAENLRNRVGLNKNNTSGFRGICHRAKIEKFDVQLKCDGKYVYVGRYESIQEAVAARDEALKKYFKEFAPV